MTCVTISGFSPPIPCGPRKIGVALQFRISLSIIALLAARAVNVLQNPFLGSMGGQVKIAVRVAVFVLGAGLLFFGWHKGRGEMMNFQTNPATPSSSYAPELFAVGGAFLVLVAFAPSPETLGRWMSRKRHKPAPQAHFRRRRKS